MVLMALVQHVWFGGPLGRAQTKSTRAAPAAELISSNTNAPWGQIEYLPLALNRPQAVTNTIQRTDTQWLFAGFSEAQLAELFDSLELTGRAKSFLANRANWQPIPGGYRMVPPADVVLHLRPESRRKLYEVLARNPENVTYRSPFVLRAGTFDEWFKDCSLPKDKVSLVRQLSYERHNLIYFADLPAFTQMATPAESTCLIQSLWRVSTFIMSVKVSRDTDPAAVMKYWGKGGRGDDYKPLVESMTRLGEGASINIGYFLPTFARLRLYTFPRVEDPKSIRQDCFWTAMNFFNERPDDRFFNSEETIRTLHSDYVQVKDSPMEFGDVLLLLSKRNEALHMCVYIADDVVFTKNGFNTLQPYVLMKLDEMLAWYEADQPFEVRAYRRKSLINYPAQFSVIGPPQ